MSALLIPCPVCRMPKNTLCRNSDDSVRKRVHPCRMAAHLAYEAVIGLAHSVPYTLRWELTREIFQTPDYSTPRTLSDTEAAQHELADVIALLEKIITHLSGRPHGMSADQLVRHLKDARSACEHHRALLVRTQEEFGLDQDAARKEADLEERLRMHRAHRMQTDLYSPSLARRRPATPPSGACATATTASSAPIATPRCPPVTWATSSPAPGATLPLPMPRNEPCPTWSAPAIA